MTYRVSLDIYGKDGETIPVHTFKGVKSDTELWECLGRLAVWYWLALDRIDYVDADLTLWDTPETRLLAFTALKTENRSRHGLRPTTLACGKCTYDGYKGYKTYECYIHVEQETEGQK